MRERGITFLLALAALVAFYGLWLRPAPSLDLDADTARPTSAERRGNGYAGLAEWLQRSRVGVRSWRERYTALADLDIPPRGNLMILTLPGMDVFRTDEFGALDKWVRRGNTLLINAALLDQPGWAVGRESGTVVEVEVADGARVRDARGTRSAPRSHAAGAARARSRRARPQAG